MSETEYKSIKLSCLSQEMLNNKDFMKENADWVGEYPDKCPNCGNLILADENGVEKCFKCGYVKSLTLNEYQRRAMTTCMDSCDNFSYMFIGLVGEVGEIASKVAKLIRKDKVRILNNDLQKYPNQTSISQENDEALLAEAGDCLWMLAGLCNTMGWKLENVARYNLDKLASRKERGVIDGNGDRR